MPVIMIHSLELTEDQKRTMAREYTKIMSELTNVPEENIYCFFSGYPLDGISAGGVLNSELPLDILKQFNIKFTEGLKEKDTIRVLSKMKTNPGMVAIAREELMSLLLKTREEVGCFGYDLFESKTDLINDLRDTSSFILMEKWKDNEAIGVHTSMDFFKNFMAKAAEYFDGAIEVTVRISSPKQSDNTDILNKVKIIHRLKAKPDKIEAVKKGLVDLSNTIAAMPGCYCYDTYQGLEGIYDPSVFILDQVWDSMGTFGKSAEYLLANLPFDLNDLTDPRQLTTFEMISQPLGKK